MDRSEPPPKGKKEAMTTSAGETTMKAERSSNANPYRKKIEEQQMEPGTAPEKNEGLIAIRLRGVTADEVWSQAANMLEKIPEMVEEAVEQLFCASTISAQVEIRPYVHEAVGRVIFDQMRAAVL